MSIRSLILFSLVFLTITGYSQNNKRDIDSIQKIIATSHDPDRILVEKAGLVTKLFTAGEQKKAENLYNQTLKEATSINSQIGLGALFHTQGNLFYYTSQFDSALHYFEKALTIRKKIKDNVGILKSTGNIGSIYYMMGQYKTALGYYEETLKKEAELNYEEGKYFSINNLGYIYARLKMFNKALYYFKKAEKIYIKNKASEQLIYTYDGLSDVYKDQEKYDSALYYVTKSKDIAESLNEQNSLSYELTSIAILHLRQKHFGPAKEYFKKALDMALKLNDKRLQLIVYGNFASIDMETNNGDSSLPYIEKIVRLQKEVDQKVSQDDLAILFAEYYYKKKDFKTAYDYIKLYEHYKDSLYSMEATKQMAEMQEKYETEKKEKENQLLQIENKGQKTTQNYLLIILAIALIGIIGAAIAYKKIKSTNRLLEIQKELVEEKQKEILDSIYYARRIQFALLASDNLLKTYLPEHFVLFKPKDVVSGDFYWGSPTTTGFTYITADCTGHGVPGAFMSLLNISKLTQIVNEKKIERPDLVLNHVRSEIIEALNPKGGNEESKDGMDAIVCNLNLKEMKLEYAAANNSFYIIRNNTLLICKADKMPVGKGYNDKLPFTYNEIALQKGDTIYTLTDGFADQFGGAKGKKFKYKQLEDLLLSISTESMQKQKRLLTEAFEQWKGKLEQVDDVCIIGVRV